MQCLQESGVYIRRQESRLFVNKWNKGVAFHLCAVTYTQTKIWLEKKESGRKRVEEEELTFGVCFAVREV